MEDDPIFDLTTAGTVEAWVYLDAKVSWAGIVHKGEKADFSDEAYSLQFWGKNGTVAFAIVRQEPSYKYSVAKSKTRLNTGAWYYVVGTWDATSVKIYINGVLDRTASNTIGEPAQTDGPIVIGSQLFSDESTLKNYYGFAGQINGVVITGSTLSDAQIAQNYTDYQALTANW